MVTILSLTVRFPLINLTAFDFVVEFKIQV